MTTVTTFNLLLYKHISYFYFYFYYSSRILVSFQCSAREGEKVVWPFKKKTWLKLTARQYGRLTIAADMLKANPSRSVELLTDMFLDQRFPGLAKTAQVHAAEKAEAKMLEEMAITGNPWIDKQIVGYVEKNSDKIGAWISGVLSDPGASAKKKQFAGALNEYLGLNVQTGLEGVTLQTV